MHLARAGKRIINCDYIIAVYEHDAADPNSPPVGTLRVVMETGQVLEFRGDDAETLRRKLDALVSEGALPTSFVGRPLVIEHDDPRTKPVRQRKHRG
jgi:hypothetical protein